MGHRERSRRKDDDESEDYLRFAKSAKEVQRLRLEKLLQDVTKPVKIPEKSKEWKPEPPPEFVRNVVGSSAGAGSGEYHIYRNLRKKECERLQYIEREAAREQRIKEFAEKVEQRKRAAEEKTAKKRAKRQKRKQKLKEKFKKGGKSVTGSDRSSDESSSEEITNAETADPENGTAEVDDDQ